MVKTNCPDTEVSYLLCNPTRAAPAGRVEFGTGCSSNIPLGITENHGFKAFFFFFGNHKGSQHSSMSFRAAQAARQPSAPGRTWCARRALARAAGMGFVPGGRCTSWLLYAWLPLLN